VGRWAILMYLWGIFQRNEETWKLTSRQNLRQYILELVPPEEAMKRFALSSLILASAMGTVVSAASPFSDLPESHWAYKQVTALTKAGVVQGTGNKKFNGDEKISRYEAAVMVHNAIRHVGSVKSAGGSVDPATMELINGLVVELADEMQMIQVRIEENADAISALKSHVANANRGVSMPVGGGNIKFMGQAMFSLVSGGDDTRYSSVNANAAGTREGSTEFLADYFMLGIEANIDSKTSFHTKANVYTGGNANTAALANAIRFDDYMYFQVQDLWSDWDLKFGRQYLPWGHELTGPFGTNPYFVSNSLVDGLYGNMIEGAYFSTTSDSGKINWGLGIHNGSFLSPLANFSHLYPHIDNLANIAGGFAGVAPFDTSAGAANGFNQNGDDSFGFIAHVGGTAASGKLNWDINWFNNGGDSNSTGTGTVAAPFARVGFGEMEFFNIGLDYRHCEDWWFAGEYVDGSVEALVNLAGRAGTAPVGTNGMYVVEDDFTTWYLQAVYNLNSKSTLAVRYSEHQMDRAGIQVPNAAFGGNNGSYDDEVDEFTIAWTRKISDNGSLIIEYTNSDYDLINGQNKANRTAAGARIVDDFDTIRVSYRIDF